MSGRGRKDAERAEGDALRTVLLAAGIAGLVAFGMAMVAVARTMDIGPGIGDILVFRTDREVPADWEFMAINHKDGVPTSCKLLPHVMAAGGGSLVVEQRWSDRRMFQVHWAGKRTSLDSTDCGPSAELLLSRADLQVLSNIVGGPGVETRKLPGL